MPPRIVYVYDKQGRVIAASVSGLVGKVSINSNTAIRSKL
jgi:hypothetical protein